MPKPIAPAIAAGSVFLYHVPGGNFDLARIVLKRLAVLEREGELVLTPLRSIREVEGVFRDYARPAPVGWDAERAKAQKAVAREAAGE